MLFVGKIVESTIAYCVDFFDRYLKLSMVLGFPNKTYQAKPNPAIQTYQTNPIKLNLPNRIFETDKITAPKS